MTTDEESAPANQADKAPDSLKIPLKVSSTFKNVVLWVLLAITALLLVMALTTFILLMQKQSEISRNSQVARLSTGSHNAMNWEEFREKMAAGLMQDKLAKIMQDALQERAVNATKLIKEIISIPDAQELNYRLNLALFNMTSSVLQKLKAELGVSNQFLEDMILRDLSNLNDTVLNRLKEELAIDPEHFVMAVHRVLEKTSKNNISFIRGKCELMHNDICYFLLKTGPVNYPLAKFLCERQGAKAANIYNKDHYQEVMSFLRKEMLPMDSLWLGMSRTATNDAIHGENGEKSTFTMPWADGYPRSFNITSHLAIKVTYNKTSSEQGFFNALASELQLGILCEM